MAHNRDKNTCLNMLDIVHARGEANYHEYEQVLQPNKSSARKIVYETRCKPQKIQNYYYKPSTTLEDTDVPPAPNAAPLGVFASDPCSSCQAPKHTHKTGGKIDMSLPSPLFLIRENLLDESPSCRHLMLLTESSSAARLLFECKLLPRNKTIVLMGSQFPRDVNSELRMVRQINEVKRAMQNGSTVVLVNHEGIFPSLYDVLNMRYTTKRSMETGKALRMLRLAVGNRSQWCSVGDGFKIIVIVDTKDAYEKLDLPLLNRFEKQMLRPNDALVDDVEAQSKLALLQEYVREIEAESQMQCPFIGMHEQTLASLVLTSSASWATLDELKATLDALVSPFCRIKCAPQRFADFDMDLFAHVARAKQQREQLLVLTFSSSHEFDVLMRRQQQQYSMLALNAVTSESEFIQALKLRPNEIKYIQCDPINTAQDIIEHARYLTLQQTEANPLLQVVFIIHLPPAPSKRKRTFQVDFQQHWTTIFIDDLLLLHENNGRRMMQLVETTPLEWCREEGNLIRICRTKLSLALAQAKPPFMPNFSIRQRIQDLFQLLNDVGFCASVLTPTIEYILQQQQHNSHVDLVARGEARAGTFTQSLLLALELITIKAFGLALRWLDQNFNLQTWNLESQDLWTRLCCFPPHEFITMQQQQSDEFLVPNTGRPGFPIMAKFPWSFRVYEALQVIVTTSSIRAMNGVLDTMFGEHAMRLANQRCLDYLFDMCSFNANRRVELAIKEQVFVTRAWLDFCYPEAAWMESMAATHYCFTEQSWAIFSLLYIRIALMDLGYPNDTFIFNSTEDGGVLSAFYGFLIYNLSACNDVEDRRKQEIWLATVRKITPHVHVKFLSTANQALLFADLLFRAAYIDVFKTPVMFQNDGTMVDFARFIQSEVPPSLVPEFVDRIAQDVVAQAWFHDEAFMHQLLDYCIDEQRVSFSVILAVCRRESFAPSSTIIHKLENTPYLFTCCVDLAEDLLQDVTFHAPPKARRIAELRQQLRDLALHGDSIVDAQQEVVSNIYARAFLLNELAALYGDFGMMEKITTNDTLLQVFQPQQQQQAKRDGLTVIPSAASMADVQRVNSGILLFGEHLYREAQDLVQEYGHTPNKFLLLEGNDEAKQAVVYNLFTAVSERSRKVSKPVALWDQRMTRIAKSLHSFQVFLLAVIYSAAMQTGQFFSIQLEKFIQDLILASNAAMFWRNHGGSKDRALYLRLAKLACSSNTDECWRDLELGEAGLEKSRLLLQVSIAAILSEEEYDNSLFGDLLRGTLSQPEFESTYIPCMFNDELEEIRSALGFVGFWACPQGHRYAVGECTTPMERGKCPECGAPIGGQNHIPVRGVHRMDLLNDGDLSKPGYIPPEISAAATNPIRRIPFGAVSFYQFCFHAVILLSPKMDTVVLGRKVGGSKTSKRQILVKRCLAFLTKFQDLAFDGGARARILAMDQDAFLLGLLAQMSRTATSTFSIPTNQLNLTEARERVEADLKTVWYLSSAGTDFVVRRVEQVKELLGMANLQREVSNLVGTQVLGLAGALKQRPTKTAQADNDLRLELWRYRDRIGLRNLNSAVEQSARRYPLLTTFCETESNLALVSCLGDVLEWSHVLSQALALRKRRITREEAAVVSNAECIDLFPTAHQRSQAKQVLDRYCMAFNKSFKLVPNLYECQRNPFLTDKLEVDLSGGGGIERIEMSPSTPVAFSLVAIVQGDADAQSLCLFQLVRALQQLNNNMLDTLQEHHGGAIITQIDADMPITTVNTPRSVVLSRLVQYDRERDLLPLLAVYSYNKDDSQETAGRTVDLQKVSNALSRRLLVGGRTMPIRVVIPQFSYANEARRMGTLAALKNRIPQCELLASVKAALVQELDSDSKILPLVEVVDNAVMFLSSFEFSSTTTTIGFERKMLLEDFAKSVLEAANEDAIPVCVRQHVFLEHLASLYSILEEIKRGTSLEELVHSKYKCPLDLQQEIELRACTPKIDLEFLLPILKDLLTNRLCDAVFPEDAPLYEYLEYCTDVDLTQFTQHLPAKLTLSVALAVWQVWIDCTT